MNDTLKEMVRDRIVQHLKGKFILEVYDEVELDLELLTCKPVRENVSREIVAYLAAWGRKLEASVLRVNAINERKAGAEDSDQSGR